MTDGWYELDDWYAPLESGTSSAQKGTVNVRTSKKATRIAGLAVIAAVLVAAVLFMIFAPSQSIEIHTYQDGSTELPKDFKEFFDSYYTTTNTEKTVISIPKAEKQSFTLSLNEPDESELSLSELYSKCSPSIVAIKAYEDDEKGYSWGSGIIVSSDGIIVTNTHVISDCSSVSVVLCDDSEYNAKLVGADAICDIAVLKIEADGLSCASFANSDMTSVGDCVAAIGNPLGSVFRLTLTDGIVSAIERNLQYKGHTMTLIQTNTALNEGNSGGALFNVSGQVIGITNMKMMSSYSSIEGIGFAIPSKTAASVVNELITSGIIQGRTSIGITVGAIPENISKAYNLPRGLYVNEVAKGSDAERKGIKEGDVITAVNSTPVGNLDDVNAIKDALGVGDMIIISYYRDGQNYDAEVMLMDTNDIYG